MSQPRWSPLLWCVPVLVALALWLAFSGREPSARPVRSATADNADEVSPDEPPPATRASDERVALRTPDEPARRQVERPSPAPAPVSSADAAPAFHGRVLDLATGEPVGHAWMWAGDIESPVDAEGRFACDRPLAPDAPPIEFQDPVHGSQIRAVAREALEPDGDGWIARIAIGPTYRLRVPEAQRSDLEGWRARLIETSADRREAITGDWLPVHDVEPPFLRYDNPWKPNRAGSVFRVEVTNEEGTQRGRSEPLSAALGIYPELVLVHVDQELATVRGRVIDRDQDPRAHARVSAASLEHPQDPLAWPAVETGDDGAFELQGLAPGTYRFQARGRRGEQAQPQRVVLPKGVTVLPDFLFPIQKPARMIAGRLVSATGAELTLVEHVQLWARSGSLELLDVTSPSVQWLASRRPLPPRGLPGEQVFEFSEVPAGPFELAVVGSSYLWDPPTVLVEAPNDQVVFTRRDDLARLPLWLRAVDAETGALIEPFSLQLQSGLAWNPSARSVAGQQPLAEFAAGVAFEWTVHAAGYRPARGDDQDLRRTERGLEGEIPLRPGYGRRFVLRDIDTGYLHDDAEGWISAGQRPPVVGATLWADGELAGRSDERGIVDLALERAPKVLEFRAPGWRRLTDPALAARGGSEAADVLLWWIAE